MHKISFFANRFMRNTKLRQGQAIISFVFAFIVVIAMAVGITRVWLWFTSNYAQRQDTYQDTRMDAANRKLYGVQEDKIAYLTAPTVKPLPPLDITDDWVFGGSTGDQEISFALQPITFTDASEECREHCDGDPEDEGNCVSEHIGEDNIIIYTIDAPCTCFDRCMCKKELQPQLDAFQLQINSINEAADSMHDEAEELRAQARKCDDWWEICWWAGFGLTAKKLNKSADKIDKERDKLLTRAAQIRERKSAMAACCEEPYETADEMDVCLDHILAEDCEDIVTPISDQWKDDAHELESERDQALAVQTLIEENLQPDAGCDLFSQLRCQKDCTEDNIEGCKTPCYDWAEDTCIADCINNECPDYCNYDCSHDTCAGLEGDEWSICMEDCVPPCVASCPDLCENFYCDTNMSENQMRRNCRRNGGADPRWMYCHKVRQCLTCDASGSNPPCYKHCMWADPGGAVPLCIPDCLNSDPGSGYMDECCRSFCCVEDDQGQFSNCGFGVMHHAQDYGKYLPWWDQLPGGHNYYLYPWVGNIVECRDNPWGRGCYQPTEFCDEDCEGSNIPPECIETPGDPPDIYKCGLQELANRINEMIYGDDGLQSLIDEIYLLADLILECCDRDFRDEDDNGRHDGGGADCIAGDTLADCQHRCIENIQDLGNGNLHDDCGYCFELDSYGDDCIVEDDQGEQQILPDCQGDCLNECIGISPGCQACCDHYALDGEPEKSQCCVLLCKDMDPDSVPDCPPDIIDVPDYDPDNPEEPWGGICPEPPE